MSQNSGQFNAAIDGNQVIVAQKSKTLPGVLSGLAPMRPVLIVGPTASGKSALALAIAETLGGVIINADAIQVFENWRVLTARPDDNDLARARHALYGHVAADAPYSVGHWLRDVAPLLHGADRPIIIGGTGLYFSALTKGLADIPLTPPEVRRDADHIRIAQGHGALLADLDPETAGRIDQRNPMRVQRAWEVQKTTGRGLAHWQDNTPPPLLPLADTLALRVDVERDWLNARIARRFDLMLDQGALDEAQANLAHWDPTQLSAKAIGAPELIAHLNGEMSLADAREKATIATCQFAKRQRTWLRSRMADWHGVDAATLG